MRSRVKDVMTTEVLTVGTSTPFKEIVNLLAAYRLSALPVVDGDRRVIGIVSEADLLLKEEYPGGEVGGWVAADFMTTPAVTVGPEATLTEAARLVTARVVKRLPVVGDDGRLVGIVSRADLLKVFLRDDGDIREEIVKDVIIGRLLMDPARFTVEVRDGVVTLHGTVERRGLIPLLVRLVHGVDGVVHVQDRLGLETDDTAPDPAAPAARHRS